ncbi:sialidase family protein [Planctomicrobium sp. SH664]|uniref:sialidase family protein n=1 Tax=Planctomicrobium sp. SH664 TaxID=3448125 RepID=UPI003F5B1162
MLTRRAILLLTVCAGFCCSHCSAEGPGPSPALPELFNLPLQPPKINSAPGPEYADSQRSVNMVIGMERTPKGRLWAAWVSGGDSELAYFVAATSDDNGETWSAPRLVIDPPDHPSGVACRALVGNFWTDPQGRLWLFVDQALGYFDGRAGNWAFRCDNPDDEHPQWSEPVRIWHGCTLNKPVVLSNGEWLLPISLWIRERISPGNEHRRESNSKQSAPADFGDYFHELDDQRMAHLFVSTDQGASWSRRGGVVFPHFNFDEHMVVELKDGRLWMLARTQQGIYESFSKDQGKTWSEPAFRFENINARFFLRRLQSGKLLLVKYGQMDERTEKRSHLRAFLSDDEGQTWKGGLLLDERVGVSYPDGCQSPDGLIRIVYDYNRYKEAEILLAAFTEADILAGEFQSPQSRQKVLVNKAGNFRPATEPVKN